MTHLEMLIAAHPFWSGVAAMWVFSAFVSGMPEPSNSSGTAYRWVYNSLHSLAANLDKALANKVPGLNSTGGSK